MASPLRQYGARVALTLATLMLCGASFGQTGYKYRDANGQWVFTDQSSATTSTSATFNLTHDSGALHISVDRVDTDGSTQLVAVNECLCVVTYQVRIAASGVADIPAGTELRSTLAPASRETLAQGINPSGAKIQLGYTWRAVLGSPLAVHRPPRPYRAPFAIGSTYLISQAYPAHFTHITADSIYAVDIALPDGTPVYAARSGMVINVHHDFFRGAPIPTMLDQANVVEILHDDGTIAVYAHLHWDSIRVRIGEQVERGQYIADSGNTGFTSGPHLHFAVLRNGGTSGVSVPVLFAGVGDIGVSPVTGALITAY